MKYMLRRRSGGGGGLNECDARYSSPVMADGFAREVKHKMTCGNSLVTQLA
jgi:hypothetical protein